MKRISIILIVLSLSALLSISSFAADSANVYVTICSGDVKVAAEPVNVADTDGDGALTINDALFAVHEKLYDGGAEAGYASFAGDYGLAISKLWGVENGVSYGYYVNNASAFNLTDPVTDGDYVVAFVYTDSEGFSDSYSYFDAFEADAGVVTLTLSRLAYDESWNTYSQPVEGAVITINGVDTAYKTDADGRVTLNADGGVISARSDDMILVPPAAVVKTVTAAPQTSDMLMSAAVIALAAVYMISRDKISRR